MNIREIKDSDYLAFSRLLEAVEQTSNYMLWEPGERGGTPDKQLEMIQNLDENSTIIVAEENNQLVGYLFAMGGKARRNRHSAYLVVGIHHDYRGRGIGKKLFVFLKQWATKHGIQRLELTVVTENQSAVSLYEKMGFEIEGTKRNSLLINGDYVDEYYMAKLL